MSRRRIRSCDFCTEVFSSEWAQISHTSRQHSDLNEIISLIQADTSRNGALTDLLQYYDPSSMDIIMPDDCGPKP